MERNGEQLREIKSSLNWVTACMQTKEGRGEGSVLTDYHGDDREFWRAFRRELIKEGFSSRVLGKHKKTIQKYVMELGERGVLDEVVADEAESSRDALMRQVGGRDALGRSVKGATITAIVLAPVEESSREGGASYRGKQQPGPALDSEEPIPDREAVGKLTLLEGKWHTKGRRSHLSKAWRGGGIQ